MSKSLSFSGSFWVDQLLDEYRRVEELEFDPKTKESKLTSIRSRIDEGIRKTLLSVKRASVASSRVTVVRTPSADTSATRELWGTLQSDVSEVESFLEQLASSSVAAAPSRRAEDIRSLIVDSSTEMTELSESESSECLSDLSDFLSRGLLLYLIAVWLRVSSEGCVVDAEHYAIRAVRVEPRLSGGWLLVGQLYSQRGETLAAKCCYQSALVYSHFAKLAVASHRVEALLLLSQVYRSPQLSTSAAQCHANALLSLECSKEAMREARLTDAALTGGIQNGQLWFSLANAYLTVFIREVNRNSASDTQTPHTSDSVEFPMAASMGLSLPKKRKAVAKKSENLLENEWLCKCIAAYKQACNSQVNACNTHPDLYYNRAIVRLHREEYAAAFADLKQSYALGNASEACQQWSAVFNDRLMRVMPLTSKFQSLLRKFAAHKKYRAKYTALGTALQRHCQSVVASHCGALTVADFSALKCGSNQGVAIGLQLVGILTALATGDSADGRLAVDYTALPFYCLAIDCALNPVIVSLFTSISDWRLTKRITDLCAANNRLLTKAGTQLVIPVSQASMFNASLLSTALFERKSDRVVVRNPFVREIKLTNVSADLSAKPKTKGTTIAFRTLSFAHTSDCFVKGHPL